MNWPFKQTASLRRLAGLPLAACVITGATLVALMIMAAPTSAQPQATPQVELFSNSSLSSVDYSQLPLPQQEIKDTTTRTDDVGYSPDPSDNRLRVAFLGNTLIQRDSQFGYLETELTRLMPDHDIVFRNLGWPGDTVSGDARVGFGRGEENVGTWRRPDGDSTGYGLDRLMQQVHRERPHVLLIGYGSNVAFEQKAGLDKFQQGLDRLLNLLQPTGVRIVLLSPPPRDPSAVPAGSLDEQNEWLAKVSNVLRTVAQQRQVRFVDLFSQWPASAKSFTDNGIHLNESGYQIFARRIADGVTDQDFAAWEVKIDSQDTSIEASGASTPRIQTTAYGLRWSVDSDHLPPTTESSTEMEGNRRTLKVEGLEAGTYVLDIDGRRVTRNTAEEWAQGVVIKRGPDFDQVEQLRQAVLHKSRLFFYGFRPQNKAYIQLFRSYERGHHAAEIERFRTLVREAESEIARLRVPQERVYELVKEADYAEHEVPEEFAEPDLEQELAAFQLPEGFQINLFASDPMIAKPININWDERGRMWVATSTVYPHLQPGQSPDDQILILEDVDRDGVADKRTVFADKLLVPQSVIPGRGGAFVTQSTDLLFLRDTDGDDQADERQTLLTGFGNADVHHMIHGLRWGPDGDLYFTQSIYINSVVETPWGVRSSFGSCTWRLRPDLLRLERFSQGLTNPWGFTFNSWGQSFSTDGAGGNGISYLFPGSAYGTHAYAGRELKPLNKGRPKECGLEYLSGRHLPEDWQNTLLTADFRANRITRYRLTEDGSGYSSEFLGDMIRSSNRAFRPVDMKVGPDGAIYIVDWYNLIIDHGEVDFHHPLRDKRHGRIWRLTYPERPLVTPPDLAAATASELLAALQNPEHWTRDQARRLLCEFPKADVLPALQAFLAEEELTDKDRLDALRVCQGLRHVDPSLLQACLSSRDHHIRAAAVRVLSDWIKQIPNALQLLEAAISDTHAQVRLEAVAALRQMGTVDAVSLALKALDQPVDSALDFALFRITHELRQLWLPEFESGRLLFDSNPQRISFAVSAVAGEASLQPLVDILKTQQVSEQQLAGILVVLAASGDQEQRMIPVERLSTLKEDDARPVATALLQSGRDRVPANAETILPLLNSRDKELRQLAVRLAGRWSVQDAFDILADRLVDPSLADAERLAVGEAIVEINGDRARDILQDAFNRPASDSVAATCAAAMALDSPNSSAGMVVTLLQKRVDPSLVNLMADALLGQKTGPIELATALDGVTLNREVSQRILERVRLAGQDLSELAQAVRAAGGLQPLASLTGAEISSILQDVSQRGDAKRGVGIFRREKMQCTTCHRVNGAGGQVGPDLSSLGGSARTSDILMSLLEPSATIKQGYQTTQVVTIEGRVISGIVQQQTDQQITLRDASNRLHTVASDDIEEIVGSRVSIMPTGLTETLTRDELIDLVTYLSTLGRVEAQR